MSQLQAKHVNIQAPRPNSKPERTPQSSEINVVAIPMFLENSEIQTPFSSLTGPNSCRSPNFPK